MKNSLETTKQAIKPVVYILLYLAILLLLINFMSRTVSAEKSEKYLKHQEININQNKTI